MDLATGVRETTTLVVHAEPARRSWLAEVVGRENAVVGAATVDEACAVLAEQPIDLVVAEATACTHALLESIDGLDLGPRTVFLDGPEDGDASNLVEALAAGHIFNVFRKPSSEGDLLNCLHQLLFPRSTERHEGLGCMVEATLADGAGLMFPILDLSNHGLSLEMPSTSGRRLLLPGTTLTALRIERDGRTLLDGVGGIVRYIELAPVRDEHDPPAYKVGVEFVPPRTSAQEIPEQIIRDPVRIRALLQEASRVGRFALRGPHDDARSTVVVRTEIESGKTELHCLGPPPAGFAAGDVLHGTFGLSGRTYSFFTTIASKDDPEGKRFDIRFPTTLAAAHRRGSPRIQPRPDDPVTVELLSPFDCIDMQCPVLDVTTSGLSFAIDPERGIFPVGTILKSLTVRFGDGLAVHTRGRVRSLSHISEGGTARMRCGIEFGGLSSLDRTRLADAIVYSERPQVRDASGTTFESIWAFLKAVGFLYPEKLEGLDVPAVQATMRKLLAKPNSVFKTFLFHQDESIQAHLSSVRLYSSTWGIQHLASARDAGAVAKARFLNLAIAEYLAQTPEIEWLKVTYRPHNNWPAFIFGRFARRIGTSPLSHIVTHGFLVARTDLEARPNTEDGLRIREALPSDLTRIEAHFVSRGDLVGLRADDLTRESLAMDTVTREYRRLGLERRREVLVAERHGQVIGFALLQVSSAGLNFSELTNAFTIHTIDDQPDATVALAQHARARYAELGRNSAIAMCTPSQTALLAPLGFEHHKDYVSWTWHRSLFQQFYEYVLRMMDENG